MRQAARAGDLLAQLLHAFGLDSRLKQYQALVLWDEVVGPQIAARARPSKIRDGVLEVFVDQPTWMQQLQLMKPQILASLNKRLGDAPLREIFLRRGKVPPRESVAEETLPTWKSTSLDQEETQSLHQLLKDVEDPGLRKQLERFLQKQARLEKARAGID